MADGLHHRVERSGEGKSPDDARSEANGRSSRRHEAAAALRTRWMSTFEGNEPGAVEQIPLPEGGEESAY